MAKIRARYIPTPTPIQVISPEGIISWYGEQAPRYYPDWQQHRAWLEYHTGSASTPCREGYELDKLPMDLDAHVLAH